MVHSDECKEVAWFSGLGAKWSAKTDARKPSKDPWDVLSTSFDLADDLERGLGPGLASNFVDPPRESGAKGEQRFQVFTEKKSGVVVLATEAGETCLEAHSSKDGLGFDIFSVLKGDSPRAQEPLFILRSNPEQDEWTLSGRRCERCESRGKRQCGNRELCRMVHYKEEVGDGHAYCMDMELPAIREDGTPEVICDVCSDDAERLGHTILTTRRPRWNANQKTLALDFRGRCSVASAWNFQLEVEGKPQSGTSRMLFGKVDDHKYVLDFQSPLGTVQAFAAALTAKHWK